MSEPIYGDRRRDDYCLIDIKIIKVKKDVHYPEGIKYSLVAIDLNTKKRVLGFDNHERKGHHMHKFSREIKYEFKDEWKLLGDFYKEYEKIKRRLK